MRTVHIFLWCAALFLFSLTPSVDLRATEAPYQFFGRHLLAQYYDCNAEALSNTKRLSEVMKEATEASGAHLLQTIEHTFKPSGFSMILLLSESHGSIHTYPEHRACFIDFFTCGHTCSPEKFDSVLRNYLQPKRVVSQINERN